MIFSSDSIITSRIFLEVPVEPLALNLMLIRVDQFSNSLVTYDPDMIEYVYLSKWLVLTDNTRKPAIHRFRQY